MKILKFGGSSLATPAAIRAVASIVLRARRAEPVLVVEAEKNGRDVVKRGFEALTSQRDNVSVILNKTRSYTPKWLNGDS